MESFMGSTHVAREQGLCSHGCACSGPVLTEDGWIGRAQFIPMKCYALCNGRELSINLQRQANKRNLLVVPGNLTRVKQRGAAAGYRISEEVTE